MTYAHIYISMSLVSIKYNFKGSHMEKFVHYKYDIYIYIYIRTYIYIYIHGMTTLNLTMPEGMFRAAPISMEFQVGSIPMNKQIWKRCMPQLLQRQPLR